MKSTELLRDSFTYAKERLPEILSSQLFAGWMIWNVYLNVLLWQHIAPKARTLAAPLAA